MRKYKNYICDGHISDGEININDASFIKKIIKADNIQCIKNMINKTNVNNIPTKFNFEKYNYLMIAIMEKNNKIIKYLLDCGANVNYINELNNNSLNITTLFNLDIDLFEIILNKTDNINQQSQIVGNNALILISGKERITVDDYDKIIKLIDAGANWGIKDNISKKSFLDYLNGIDKKRIIEKYPLKYKKYLDDMVLFDFNI